MQDWLSGCGGVLQLWPGSVDVVCGDAKRVSRDVQFEAKWQETTRNYARLETIMAITSFQTGLSWQFRSFKDDVLKIEL